MTYDDPYATPTRSQFVTAVAWVFIVLSGFATLISLLQNAMIGFAFPLAGMNDAVEKMRDDPNTPPTAMFMFEHMRLFFAAYLLASITTFVSSVGLLKRKNWARLLFVAMLAVGIISNLGGIVWQNLATSSMSFDTDPQSKLNDHAFQSMRAMMTVMQGVSAVIAIAIAAVFAWIIKRLVSPAIRQEFAASGGTPALPSHDSAQPPPADPSPQPTAQAGTTSAQPSPAPEGIGVPAYVIAGLSFIPGLGAFFGVVALAWGLASSKKGGKIVAGIGAGGILVTVLLFGSMFYFAFSKGGGFYDEMRAQMAQTSLNSLVEAVEFYKVQHGAYPESLKALRKSLPRDSNVIIFDPSEMKMGEAPRNFYYERVDDDHYYLRGLGPDGVPFTPDDLIPQIRPAPEGKMGLLIEPPAK